MVVMEGVVAGLDQLANLTLPALVSPDKGLLEDLYFLVKILLALVAVALRLLLLTYLISSQVVEAQANRLALLVLL
tara:strand:+ start:189 stop:416 length:228 start_codon:yes stop_codon:yes gene_type:complete